MFEEMKYILFGFTIVLFVNSLIQYSYPYFGCTEMNLTNLFRGNLWCVAFTNINYHVQSFQDTFLSRSSRISFSSEGKYFCK